MPGDEIDSSVIAARRGLLDALEALGPHAQEAVLIGAQAVYVHTQDVVTGVALATKDADIMLIPPIATTPGIDGILQANGFRPGSQPGIWISGEGDREVDLLVPETLAPRPGHRSARLTGHGAPTARLVPGIEGAIADFDERTIGAYELGDERRIVVRVAGPAALLVAKGYKLADRLAETRRVRLSTKDAFDVYRLLQLPLERLLLGFERMSGHPSAAATAEHGIEILAELFGTAGAEGVRLAGQHVEGVGDPEIVRLSTHALASELLRALRP
jgi:hypothetical protein